MLRFMPVFACGLLLAACSATNDKQAVSAPEETGEAARVSVTSEPGLAATADVRNPELLDKLLHEHQAEIAWELGEGPNPGTSPEEIRRIKAEIDRVAGQVDGWVSGLYWQKSLEDATSVAEATGKPVLMLRLLGNLDDEFC